MKILALILSIYVIALTAMSCPDVQVVESESNSIEILQQSQYHTENIDLCSPFCFCNCCQTLSHPEYLEIVLVEQIAYSLIVPLIENNIPNPVISFWRPPKYVQI
jgi:hypothetical protein